MRPLHPDLPKTAAIDEGPSQERTLRFTRVVIVFAILYSLFATRLGFRIVVQQQAIRQHLALAQTLRPRGLFPSTAAARQTAQRYIGRLNTLFPRNPCGTGPAFLMTQSANARGPDCRITITVQDRRIKVHGYDTQGYRMDNVFERLNPPPRRL